MISLGCKNFVSALWWWEGLREVSSLRERLFCTYEIYIYIYIYC
jgi:hypothetical protein